MKRSGDTQMGGSTSRFPRTRWTDIRAARTDDQERRRAALGTVALSYWKPVYVYLRRKGLGSEEAKDLTQGFFTDVILKRRLVDRADPAVGTFRSYLKTAVDRYVIDAHRRANSRTRKPPGRRIIPLDAFEEPPAISDRLAAPDKAFCHAWACQLLDDVLAAVANACRRPELASHWEVFRQTVVEPLLRGTERPSLIDVCTRLGIADTAKAANMVVTVKRRFRAVLRARIGEYAETEEAIDGEIRDLMALLGNGG
jgi:DNA-directed RNA polymerase specialized sigma24 family protein